MAAKKVIVTYADPEREPVEVKITPKAQVATERHIGGDWSGMALLSVYYMAWVALLNEDPTSIPGFEAWLDTVDSVEDKEDAKPDPTPSDPFDEASLS
jgi:hypothetical protein